MYAIRSYYGVFYRRVKDQISTVILVDRADLNRLILTDDNFDNTSSYGFELSSSYRPTKWWTLNGSFDLYSQTQRSISERLTVPADVATENDIVLETVEVDNVAYNFRVFNNFSVSQKLAFTAFGFYRGKNKSIQFDIEPMYFVNLGMRYSFLENNAATLSFNYNDVLNSMKFQGSGNRPFVQDVEFNWESNTWSIGFRITSYNVCYTKLLRVNLNYRNGKFNVYGNYSNNISKNVNYGYIDRVESIKPATLI